MQIIEYRGPFEKYSNEYVIQLEKTIRKTSQQNIVADKMNRTIMKLIQCTPSHAKLPILLG